MGRRDIHKKETKKPKKDHKNTPQLSIVTPTPSVEVVGKHKKRGREEEA